MYTSLHVSMNTCTYLQIHVVLVKASIDCLPDQFGRLTKLEMLDLRDCDALVALPPGLYKLQATSPHNAYQFHTNTENIRGSVTPLVSFPKFHLSLTKFCL